MATNKIVLGSGKLFVVEATYDSQTGLPVIGTDATIETSANLIGYIQGGASLNYTPEWYEAKDDLGFVSRNFLTKEEVVLKSGVMTWNGDVLKKLCSTAAVTTTPGTGGAAGIRTVKIGGINNNDGKNYIVRFLHEDAKEGDIRLTVVGSNQAAWELNFAADKETVINAEFKAIPNDARGTLVIYAEEDSSITQ